MIRRIRQAIEQVESLQHFGDVVHNRKWAALLEIRVEMRGIGRDDDPAAARPNPRDLQARRMTADAVQGQPRHKLGVAIVEDSFVGIDVPQHHLNIFKVERAAKHLVAHVAAGRIGHVAILEMKARARQTVEIAGVIVMQMRDDDVGDLVGIDVEQTQRLDRAA